MKSSYICAILQYVDGSLLNYAVKKEKLLLEVRKSIDVGTLIDLIAAGLPNHVLNRIERESLQQTEDLFNEVNKLEYLAKNKNFKREKNATSDNGEKGSHKEPCKACKELNKGIRYHPSDKCWFKTKEEGKEKRMSTKQENNAIIEAEYSEEDKKNGLLHH